MKSLKLTFFLLLALGSAFSSHVFAIKNSCDANDDYRDFEIVENFIDSKRKKDYRQKGALLEFTGDARAVYVNRHERQDGIALRGRNSRPVNAFFAEFNVKMNYRAEGSWAHVHLQLEEDAGTEIDLFGRDNCKTNPGGSFGSGFCDERCLKRAYFGFNIYKKCDWKFDIEFGRRPLYYIFDSRIQFHARADGLVFKGARKIQKHSEVYLKVSPFVVDDRVNYFAYCAEAGYLNILEYRFDLIYSYIDWSQKGRNACEIRNPRGWQFRNSQLGLAYNFDDSVFKTEARLYSAVLYNHAAQSRIETHHKKKPYGWYAGFIIGEGETKGQWCLDCNYQWVQAQAISDCDVHGIDRGNALRESFTTPGVNRGKSNYKGAIFDVVYVVTDDLYLDASYQFSRAEDKAIGGPHHYDRFEFNVIQEF